MHRYNTQVHTPASLIYFPHHCRVSWPSPLSTWTICFTHPSVPFSSVNIRQQHCDSHIKFCPRKQIGREGELTVMFVLRNTGSLSLGSSVTDWLMKGCFFRAQMILLQSLNPKSGTFNPVQIFYFVMKQKKKKLLRIVDCFELPW